MLAHPFLELVQFLEIAGLASNACGEINLIGKFICKALDWPTCRSQSILFAILLVVLAYALEVVSLLFHTKHILLHLEEVVLE